MQFLVPQFIETEDKVVGPLTIRQFGYLAVAGIICFILFFIVNLTAWIIFAVLFGGLGVAFAFFKMDGRPLSVVVVAALHYFWQPNQYTWQQDHPVEKPVAKTHASAPTLEKLVASVALKTAWRTVATGSKEPEAKVLPPQAVQPRTDRYQIFTAAAGDKRAARRVDYR